MEGKAGRERQVGEEHSQTAGGKRQEEVSCRKLGVVWCVRKGEAGKVSRVRPRKHFYAVLHWTYPEGNGIRNRF